MKRPPAAADSCLALALQAGSCALLLAMVAVVFAAFGLAGLAWRVFCWPGRVMGWRT